MHCIRLDGLMVSIGKDFEIVHYLRRYRHRLIVPQIRQTLMTIRRIRMDHHQMTILVGIRISENLLYMYTQKLFLNCVKI